MEKFYSSKTLLKLSDKGMHPPLDPPLDACSTDNLQRPSPEK